MKAAMQKVDAGLPVISERETVATFMNRWLADVVTPSVRPKTLTSYEQLVRRHINPALEHISLARLSPQDVQKFMNAKLPSGLSPRTVQYLRAILRRALGQALRWDLVSRNVATLVDPPRSVRHEITPLTPLQATAFLAAVKGDRNEALYTVAIALGLRQGEALGLRWSDVNLDAGTLTVSVALQRVNGILSLVEPKTRRSRRTVSMPPTVIASLRDHRIRQLEERLSSAGRWDESWNFVFPSTIGTPQDAGNVVRQFHAALDKAGLPSLRFHDLRHTCASLLLAQGQPRMIMDVLGHSQISLTLDTYSHVMPEMRKQAVDMMERLLNAG